MTDVYIAYAREDRDRLRLITEMLRFEGWDLWMDPFDLSDEPSPVAELKLASARVILTFWSDRSRTSEVVRSEAATGLYKNKLVQLRIDGGAPPRPFDQVESLDFAHWRGDIDDPIWRRLIAGLKQHAGEPAGTRALPNGARKVMAPPPMPSGMHPTMQPDMRPVMPPVMPMSLSQPRPAMQPQPQQAPPPRQVYPPLQPVQQPPQQPVYQMPPVPPPVYQMPPQQPQPQPQPQYQPLPPLQPPTYQMAQQPIQRAPVYDLPPAPPPLPPLMQPPPPVEQQWRRSGGAAEFAEARSDSGRSGGAIGYAEVKRGGLAWGPVAAAAVLIVSGVGLWLGDPFGWRTGAAPSESQPIAMAARTVSDVPVANGEPATPVIEDTEESAANWTRVNRKSAEALRDYVTEFPRASTAETARSLMRVMDAQAWVTAVTADNDAAYQAYLKRFPAEGVMPGAMAPAAGERLAALGKERQQAIEEIQRGLTALNLYAGAVDGKTGGTTAQAVTKFASANRRSAPSLSTSSPRELRTFAEAVRRAGSREVTSVEVAAASEADLLRVAQAQAKAKAASLAVSAKPDGNADSLAVTQRLAETQAWAAAEQTGTAAAYQAFLTTWPNGANAAAARAALAKANKPAPYSLDLLSADVRSVVEAARRAQASANQKAAAARQAASAADALSNASTITGANGDRYVTQIANGAPNGVGLRVRGPGANAGDRYRGELRNGQASGVGVYEFSDNAGNSGARAQRYEGDYANDAASGYGVFHWRSGDSLAGSGAGGGGQARGVLSYDNGQRYEGEMVNGQRDGVGVFWASDGSVMQAGRWSKDTLAEAMKAPAP